jgi:triacylglycerol esterase/lipase EstA (alpha/beta hydrolase family)
VDTPLPRATWKGATLPDLHPQRAVLVFLHGLNGRRDGWFGETMYYGRSDMYDTAHAAGYKTFLVDLHDVDATAETSIDNGLLQRRRIGSITHSWGMDSVNMVAHSKGGPDSSFAAISGAPIDRIVTLGGENDGSIHVTHSASCCSATPGRR